MKNEIHIYTDGSSFGNPGPGGWGAILFGEKFVKEIGGGEKKTTNNAMELEAVRNALFEVSKRNSKEDIKIFSDSKYVLRGITEWSKAWEKNGWMTKAKTEVANRELWEAILKLKRDIETSREISFQYVPGHAEHPGNERADEIAQSFSAGKSANLYDGRGDDYSLDLGNFKIDQEKLEKRKSARKHSNAKAYSYLSLVDNKLMRHTTWGECEARVKGKKGVKFKKAISKEDEENILREWGIE